MKVGGDRKKIIMLGALGVVLAWSFYTNVLSDPALPEQARQQQKQPQSPRALPRPEIPGPDTRISPASRAVAERRRGRAAIGEYKPTLKFRPEDRPDPMKVDPTLRTDLLAKLQGITVEGGHRSLFEFSTAPPPPAPKTPDPKITPGAKQPGQEPTVAAELKPVDPPKPPPPPIPFKFYGFTSPPNAPTRRAFFLEGEEIFVAAEGELIKKRYKVIRITINTVVIEDTDHKHQQTLRLEEPPATG